MLSTLTYVAGFSASKDYANLFVAFKHEHAKHYDSAAAESQAFKAFSSRGPDRRISPESRGQLSPEMDVQVLQLRLSLAEAQAGNQRLQLQIEQARVQLQDSKNAGLLAALPLEQKRAEVRQLELQLGRQAELS